MLYSRLETHYVDIRRLLERYFAVTFTEQIPAMNDQNFVIGIIVIYLNWLQVLVLGLEIHLYLL